MRVEEEGGEARDAKESDQIMYSHVGARSARLVDPDASGPNYIDF